MRGESESVVVPRGAPRSLYCAGAALAAGLALLSMAGAASAQVAAPPLSPFSFVTDNPAAMQWGTPSRIGAAYSKGDLVTDPATTRDDFEGGSAGVRLVDRPASGALDYSRIDSTTKPFHQAEYDEILRAALAIRLGNQISLGVGQTNEQTETGGVSGQTRDTLETPLYGVTVRPTEWLFLGAAGGNESVRHEVLNFPAGNYHTTRDVYLYGVGIRAGTEDSAIAHLEYYATDRGSYANGNIAGGRENSRTAVAELIVQSFLAGVTLIHTERDTGFPVTDETRIEVGLVPMRGYALVVRRDTTVDTFPAGSAFLSRTGDIYSIAIMYQFRGLDL